MLRIQNSSTMCTTALLLVFHAHIFLLHKPRAVRQREGRKLQKFPFSARKTVLKNHRGWRLLSHHTFQSCKEEKSSWLASFLLLPKLRSFNITALRHLCSRRHWKLRGWGILPSWIPDHGCDLHQGLAPLYRHILFMKAQPDREVIGKTFTFTKNFASVPAHNVNYQ